jgi:hypothetical protein
MRQLLASKVPDVLPLWPNYSRILIVTNIDHYDSSLRLDFDYETVFAAQVVEVVYSFHFALDKGIDFD